MKITEDEINEELNEIWEKGFTIKAIKIPFTENLNLVYWPIKLFGIHKIVIGKGFKNVR